MRNLDQPKFRNISVLRPPVLASFLVAAVGVYGFSLFDVHVAGLIESLSPRDDIKLSVVTFTPSPGTNSVSIGEIENLGDALGELGVKSALVATHSDNKIELTRMLLPTDAGGKSQIVSKSPVDVVDVGRGLLSSELATVIQPAPQQTTGVFLPDLLSDAQYGQIVSNGYDLLDRLQIGMLDQSKTFADTVLIQIGAEQDESAMRAGRLVSQGLWLASAVHSQISGGGARWIDLRIAGVILAVAAAIIVERLLAGYLLAVGQFLVLLALCAVQWLLLKANIAVPLASSGLAFLMASTLLRWSKFTGRKKFTERIRTVLNQHLPAQDVDAAASALLSGLTPRQAHVTAISVMSSGASMNTPSNGNSSGGRIEWYDLLAGHVFRSQGVILQRGEQFTAIFGIDLATGQTVEGNHAEMAVQCALSMLHDAVSRATAPLPEPSYPLRIGVSTGLWLVGFDVTNPKDPKMIALQETGEQATELAQAAKPCKPLLSASTKDLLGVFPKNDPAMSLAARKMILAENARSYDVYELNPFEADEGRLAKAHQVWTKRSELTKRDPRCDVGPGTLISATSEEVKGKVLNFSLSGLLIEFDQYLMQGSVVRINLDSESGKLAARLRSLNIDTIAVEVKWSDRKGESFLHGVAYAELGDGAREAIFHAIKTECPNAVSAAPAS